MYVAQVEKYIDMGESEKGYKYWNSIVVGIFDINPVTSIAVKVGEYTRNYPDLFNTFCPFTLGGKDYALYSPDYTTTRVMSLPDCKDIGGESPNAVGFCPNDYYIHITPRGRILGFVSGCIWGDDSSIKLEYLDLSRADEGIIKREDRFGYFELPDDYRIQDALDIDDEDEDDEDSDLYFVIKGKHHFSWAGKEVTELRKVK